MTFNELTAENGALRLAIERIKSMTADIPEITDWAVVIHDIADEALAHPAAPQPHPNDPPGSVHIPGTGRHIPAEVLHEIKYAMDLYPTWPDDPFHALAIVMEEFGELTKAMVQLTYPSRKSVREDVNNEAVQCAAMAIRFVLSLDEYNYLRSTQHGQVAAEQPPTPGGHAVADEEVPTLSELGLTP